MEVAALSVGKSVLMGALGYGKSKAGEEVALQLDVEYDGAFIAHELEMMQSFLMMADEERRQNKVLITWVKHVRHLAYTAENSLMDFSLLSEKKKSWWRRPQTMVERRRIAMEMKKLRARVEDVSNRNLRYSHINDSSGSKPIAGAVDASMAKVIAGAVDASMAKVTMFGGNEARFTPIMGHIESSEVSLHHLITRNVKDLSVVAVWGTSNDLWKTSAIQEVYDDPEVLKRFGFRAWVRLLHPFDPQEFLRSLVRQFYENSHDEVGKAEQETSIGVDVLAKMENMKQSDLVRVFNAQICSKSYLVVINQLSTIEEWHRVKKYFPDNKKQSRIIVSAQQVEIASLCMEKPYQVSKIEQLSYDQIIYLFHKKEENKELDNADKDKACNSTARKKFDRSRTLALADEVICGRETERSILIKLVGQPDNDQGDKVISVWGKGGLGKTTLVRSVYQSHQLGGWKRAWATAMRPFNPEVLLRDLALQLQEGPAGSTSTGVQKMRLQELNEELARVLKTKRRLVVIDDIWSISEWEFIKRCLQNAGRIIVTTREKNIAKHCSIEEKNMYSLEGLKDDAALELFIKKVFKNNVKNNNLFPAMREQARLLIQKCGGLPLAISTIGGFLAIKPKTATEWKKMSDGINNELEINPELRAIKTILMRSYDGLPYHPKVTFLYLSIFPGDYKIRWSRLVRRWIAEGYARDMQGMTAIELCWRYFDELLDRSMILPGEGIHPYSQKIKSCQLHDMMREVCISKAREENLVFTLEEGCCLSDTQGAIRHLVIGSNWKRDKDVLESKLDLSHVRSLTVFGEWRPFFISDKIRFLRVLDLEDTWGLRNHHLDKIWHLCHLKYLSLRGCGNISCLPNSLWSLSQLETLDVRGTGVYGLPTTITNLQKLQHLHGDGLFLGSHVLDACLNRCDSIKLNNFCKGRSEKVVLPRGIGKLKALHTLGYVDVSSGRNGNATVKELGELTQLRKLKVFRISGANINELWSATARHSQLQSLSVEGESMFKELDGCLGEALFPPSSLESLTLIGKLVNATEWIHKLQNLSKLVLRWCKLEQDDAIDTLGSLPSLAILRLLYKSFDGTMLHFQSSSFLSLIVLELYVLENLQSVVFEEGAMPKLEMVYVRCSKLNAFSGVSALRSLMEIRLSARDTPASVKEDVERQAAEHMNHVRVNFI